MKGGSRFKIKKCGTNTLSRETSFINGNGEYEVTSVSNVQVNMRKPSQSDTCIQRGTSMKASCLHREATVFKSECSQHNEMSISTSDINHAHTSSAEEIGRNLYNIISELEKVITTLKKEYYVLEVKLKKTEEVLMNTKGKLGTSGYSQELGIVVNALKDELKEMKRENDTLKETPSNEAELNSLVSSDASSKENSDLHALLDIMKTAIEPEKYNIVLNMYRHKTGKIIETHQNDSPSEAINENQVIERRISSIETECFLRKGSKNLEDTKKEVLPSNVIVNSKEESHRERETRKQRKSKVLSELHIIKAENDNLRSQLKIKNEQILKLLKDTEYLNTTSRRKIEELKKDIAALLRKGGQTEALWSRCLELKQSKENIEKEFFRYKEAQNNAYVGIRSTGDSSDEQKTDSESSNSHEDRNKLNAAMNQINKMKLENDRLRFENKNLMVQIEHFQRLALYSQQAIPQREEKRQEKLKEV